MVIFDYFGFLDFFDSFKTNVPINRNELSLKCTDFEGSSMGCFQHDKLGMIGLLLIFTFFTFLIKQKKQPFRVAFLF
jgi:hypothetical protein